MNMFMVAILLLCGSIANAEQNTVYMLMREASFTIAPMPQGISIRPLKSAVTPDPALTPAFGDNNTIQVGVDTRFEVLDSIETADGERFVNVRFNGETAVWVGLEEIESVPYIQPGAQIAFWGAFNSGGSVRARARRIVSRLGCHPGVDIRMRTGTPVTARGSGRVIMAGNISTWGGYVRISHGNGYTGYAHLSRVAVRNGQSVSAGTVIGYSGSTGLSTGPHLHLEDTRPGSRSRACILRRDGGRR
jgi:murein DD-endopeptidase MepM/ murein hydrolase activator NlpD